MIIETSYDPTNAYKDLTTAQLREACGLLLLWIAEASVKDDPVQPLSEGLAKRYSFFTGWMPLDEEAYINSDGVYYYPDDDPLYPYISIRQPYETIFIYPYGLVAVVTPTSTKITRMD